ncbi:hypothetical protein ElyMa_003724600 [Elysia marginata]|uniref:Uncharacterized protein n=1 Tax=Elysia marginata TaxID=1093978 RepID=A0AAV4F456_9GAST|nr:hypothetical protein ElyMa_003724600 [Elysia marginata]
MQIVSFPSMQTFTTLARCPLDAEMWQPRAGVLSSHAMASQKSLGHGVPGLTAYMFPGNARQPAVQRLSLSRSLIPVEVVSSLATSGAGALQSN